MTDRPITPTLDRVKTTADMKALLPWLTWAFETQKAALKAAA